MATVAKADLTVSSLTVSSGSILPGGNLTLSFSIADIGNASANGTVAGIYININGKLTLLSSLWTPALNPGGVFNSGNITVTLPSNIGAGNYSISVTADINGVIAESNEGNNSRAGSVNVLPMRPDLVVSGLGNLANPVVGGNLKIDYAVANNTTAGAGTFYTRFYLSRDAVLDAGDTVLATVGDKSLAGFAQRNGSVDVTLPSSFGPGWYTIFAVTDYTGAVAEMNENNNVRTLNVLIQAPPKPDLVMTTLSLSNPQVLPGGKTTVTFKMANAGTAASSPSTAGIYLEANGTKTLLASVAVPSIGKNYSTDFGSSVAVTIPSSIAGGSYKITVSTDIANGNAEIDETNNSMSTNLRVVGSAANVFSFFGGQLSTLVDLSSAAYRDPTKYNSDAEISYSLLGNQMQWLSSNDLPVAGMSSGGLFKNQNGAALIGRTSDALFISFRGTDEKTSDVAQWFARQDHWALFNQLVPAIDQYVKANHISKVYVTGHSLGGAMAQQFMATHADGNGVSYRSDTFASPGYGVGLQALGDVADDRILNIWSNADPILAASALGQRNVRGDQIFVMTSNLNAADIPFSHAMSLYESIAFQIDSSRQKWQIPDGGQIADGVANRISLTLSTGKQAFGPAANTNGQNWVNSLVPGALAAVSDKELTVANFAAGVTYVSSIVGKLALTT
jgi:subtilase family serine protease/pimeloyl-ACP methyl ester carboxylesterase